MKVGKKKFMDTLLKGEKEGHCKGISQRLDDFHVKQRLDEEKRVQRAREEMLQIVKAKKAQKDELK
jgi:hypothetical protein